MLVRVSSLPDISSMVGMSCAEEIPVGNELESDFFSSYSSETESEDDEEENKAMRTGDGEESYFDSVSSATTRTDSILKARVKTLRKEWDAFSQHKIPKKHKRNNSASHDDYQSGLGGGDQNLENASNEGGGVDIESRTSIVGACDSTNDPEQCKEHLHVTNGRSQRQETGEWEETEEGLKG